MNRFECHRGPPGPGFLSLSAYPGPGGSWGSGVSAILPASKDAESPSRITIPYPPPPLSSNTHTLTVVSCMICRGTVSCSVLLIAATGDQAKHGSGCHGTRMAGR